MTLSTFAERPRYARPVAQPIHWPGLVAGSFVSLALFVLSAVLAQACDVDITFQAAHAGAAETGAIIWGAVAAIICFGIGSWCANYFSDLPNPHAGWIQGLMVWAVVVPILLYCVGSGIGPRLSQHSNPQNWNRPFAANTDNVNANGGAAASSAQPEIKGSATYISHPQAAAWWMLLSLGLGLFSAVGCGLACGHMNGSGAADERSINVAANEPRL